uniref:Small G protein signaling modulator 3 n=1 Tax=Sus scrofa TaxID=9823 RepID=A0A8D0PRD6_PIG
MPKGGGWSHGERPERWLWVRGETWSGDPEHRQWRGSLPRPPCRRRPPAGPAAGRPPAEAALAGPPRVHAQPRRGRPHLGQDCRLPAPLREAPRPGAGRRPPQHEAAGEAAGGGAGVGPGPRAEGRARPSPQLWMRLSGALQKKRSSELTYRELVKNSSNDDTMAAKQIEKDLLRTMPSNACFASESSVGVPRLRRVLRALAWLYPEIGYCQGTGMVAACLLLFLEEEDAFWMMCAIIEDLLPASYFSTTLLGVQTDQRVLRHLIVQYLPRLDKLLQEHDIELSLITLHWFLTAFASVVHIKLLLRLWDLFFYEGSLVLFQTTLGMLRLKEEELIQSENSASIFNTLSDIPSQMEDADLLLGEAMRLAGSLTDVAVETQRRKHLAYLIADQGQLLGTSTTTNLSQVVRRRTQRRKSGISSLLFGEDDLEALKAKNIKQTELVADLREAILRVARHFQCTDPKNCSVELTPDYSMESHQRDHENYVACSRSHPRRAKALLDFERHDDDELGFRKNDIITIISQKDEHCWVGELNGLRGWFPAKFVEVLDERSKEYSIAGDDAVTEGVTDLVRGTLCPALKALFEHGLKKPSLLGGACHPWLFIEEVSQGLGPCPSLSSSLRPVELAAGAGGVATGPQLDSGFDLVAPLGSLTLTPPRRQRAGRSRETSTPCIRAWCCVRRTGWMKTAKSSPRRSCSTGLCSRST